MLYQSVLAFSPAKALPLLPAAEAKAYKISLRPCDPVCNRPVRPAGATTAMAEKSNITALGVKMPNMAILTSPASIF